jgi:hypothetical protein
MYQILVNFRILDSAILPIVHYSLNLPILMKDFVAELIPFVKPFCSFFSHILILIFHSQSQQPFSYPIIEFSFQLMCCPYFGGEELDLKVYCQV